MNHVVHDMLKYYSAAKVNSDLKYDLMGKIISIPQENWKKKSSDEAYEYSQQRISLEPEKYGNYPVTPQNIDSFVKIYFANVGQCNVTAGQDSFRENGKLYEVQLLGTNSHFGNVEYSFDSNTSGTLLKYIEKVVLGKNLRWGDPPLEHLQQVSFRMQALLEAFK